MENLSPLRYPGGKRRLTLTVVKLLELNGLTDVEYVEPYAGGAAVALNLLLGDHASLIHINDLSRPVFAFWHSVLNETEWLCRRIKEVQVTMNTWQRQRAIFLNPASYPLRDLGFAALFLNRTNRSGIIRGGVIGGKAQDGKWKLDVRFNREDLIRRIKRIERYKSRIKLYNLDASRFIDEVLTPPAKSRRRFVFFDPPYIEAGQQLYLNEYSVDDHKALAGKITTLKDPWIVTYDRAAIDYDLFAGHQRIVYDLHYTVQDRYQGREALFLSKNLVIPRASAILAPRMRMISALCRTGS